jgi:hypothetical protein
MMITTGFFPAACKYFREPLRGISRSLIKVYERTFSVIICRGLILGKLEPSSGCVSHIRPFPAGLN